MTDSAGAAGADRPEPPMIVVDGPIPRAAVAHLCEQISGVLASQATSEVTCDVAALTGADIDTVDALARLQLTARRAGGQLRLRHPSQQVRELLALTGLYDVLPAVAGSADRSERQIEEREEPVGVEEGDHPADPVA